MKTSQIARGIVGALSLMGVIGAVGCSAGYDGEGVAGEGEIGETSQALNLTLTATNVYDVKFPASIAIPGTNDVLEVGGYNAAGTGVPTIKRVTYNQGTATVTWNNILNSGGTAIALPANRGEAEIARISGNLYLVTGGRVSQAGTIYSTAHIIDITPNAATVSATISMNGNQHVNHKLVACGSQFLVMGGEEAGSVPSDKLEVFRPSTSDFAPMKNKLTPFSTITLRDPRRFFGAFSLSPTSLIAFGGDDASGTLLNSTEKLTVDSACNLDVGNAATVLPAVGGTMPVARTKFAAALTSLALGAPSVTYDVIAAGGQEGAAAVLTTQAYDVTSDTWIGSAGGTPSASVGHIRPSFAIDGAGGFALIGGSNVAGTASVATADILSAGTFSAVALKETNGRFGSWAAFTGATPEYIVAQGVKLTPGATALLSAE